MSETAADDAEGAGQDYSYGRRGGRVYPLTERELQALVWAPVWTRWFMVRCIRRETKFDHA